MVVTEEIKARAAQLLPTIREIRHHLHKHPELSFEEVQTSAYICSILDKHNITYTKGWAGTGVLATIVGRKDGAVRGLRADIDALPIQEESNSPYASQNPGVMHACGHDVHTATMLGALLILNSLKDEMKGVIKCIFQPGEEKHPGGAKILLEEKVFGEKYPEFIIGQHVHPPLQAGKVGQKSGQFMASADEIFITIKGKGGHAALPHNAIDPIVVASHLIIQLQEIISRKKDPTIPSLLTIGKIYSVGGATNIIPDEVKLEGTFRSMDEKWRFQAHKHIRNVCDHVTAAMGANYELDLKVGYPSLYNDPRISILMKAKMIEYLGSDQVEDLDIRMTAEDFAYYSQVMPAYFYRLGTGNPSKGIVHSVHTSKFDIDESALEIGAGLMAYLAFE